MDERDFEMADALAAAERDSSAARASRAVAGAGRADCQDCGERLTAARRQAAPFALRCLECQQAHEKRKRQFAA